jgi:hypothetical protein
MPRAIPRSPAYSRPDGFLGTAHVIEPPATRALASRMATR